MASQLVNACFAIAVLLSASLAKAAEHYEFSYSGVDGVDHWGNISRECIEGKRQSPINIVKKALIHNKKLTPLVRNYKPTNATLVNNGYDIVVAFEGHVGNLVIDGKNYSLKFAAELHQFHVAEDNNGYAVVSLLYQLGAPDPFLSKLNKSLEKLAKDPKGHIPLGIVDSKLVRKNTRKYFRYIGSRTAPPCSEIVIWNVLGKVRSISKEQVAALKAPLKDNCKANARPAQPLNGRKIELFNEHII